MLGHGVCQQWQHSQVCTEVQRGRATGVGVDGFLVVCLEDLHGLLVDEVSGFVQRGTVHLLDGLVGQIVGDGELIRRGKHFDWVSGDRDGSGDDTDTTLTKVR
ncbi:hypothetical protein WICPIJ_002659 [Wickerhamomyces pijperi]|uniref:Uncharacterized protein n=1 Tax=Wickerhamomyces pijperi TaxID=599730 RepID=A0A9P8QB98_WICPI|nr:hypothetical protein WICPIJ_002659 [Wickerhamomyces pijperi]